MKNVAPPPGNSGDGLDMDTEILKVSSLIATARRLLAENKMVDLSALSGKVMTLCDAVKQEGPAKKTKKIISAVGEISDDLDLLEKELTAQHKGVNAIFQDAPPRQMVSAYTKVRDET